LIYNYLLSLDVEAALDWIIGHLEDPDADAPLNAEEKRIITKAFARTYFNGC